MQAVAPICRLDGSLVLLGHDNRPLAKDGCEKGYVVQHKVPTSLDELVVPDMPWLCIDVLLRRNTGDYPVIIPATWSSSR